MPPFTTLDLCSVDFGDDETHHDFSLEQYGTHWSTDASDFFGPHVREDDDTPMASTAPPKRPLPATSPDDHANQTKKRAAADSRTHEDKLSREPTPERDPQPTNTGEHPQTPHTHTDKPPAVQWEDQPGMIKRNVVVNGLHFSRARHDNRFTGGKPSFGIWFYGAFKPMQNTSVPVDRYIYMQDHKHAKKHNNDHHKHGGGSSEVALLAKLLHEQLNGKKGGGTSKHGGGKNTPNLHRMSLKLAMHNGTFSTIANQFVTTMDFASVRDRVFVKNKENAITCMRHLVRQIRSVGKGSFVLLGNIPMLTSAREALTKKMIASPQEIIKENHAQLISSMKPDTETMVMRLVVTAENEAVGIIQIQTEKVKNQLLPTKLAADGVTQEHHQKTKCVILSFSPEHALHHLQTQQATPAAYQNSHAHAHAVTPHS